ncbi:MAG: hypothetical protein ABI611_22900, partial [Solirubrobacteraceae bacterium]
MTEFGVETIHLDLAPLAAALSRRLHDAGVPMTPERPADFARALTLVRPVSRQRLYWTARSVFVSDQAHAQAFDRVFFSVFGRTPSDHAVAHDERRTEGAPPDERPAVDGAAAGATLGSTSPRAGGSGDEDAAEVEVPLAMASDEERLAGKRFDALDPHELAQLYRLMTRLEVATPLRRTRRHERARHGRRTDLRRT